MNSSNDFHQNIVLLAAHQTLYKLIAAEVRTGKASNIRGVVDKSVTAFYGMTGAKSFDVIVDGATVGTISLRISEEVHDIELRVNDSVAFDEWLIENDLAKDVTTYEVVDAEKIPKTSWQVLDRLAKAGAIVERRELVRHDNYMLEAKKQAVVTGEVPDGCDVVAVDQKAQPVGTTVKIDERKVLELMRDQDSELHRTAFSILGVPELPATGEAEVVSVEAES